MSTMEELASIKNRVAHLQTLLWSRYDWPLLCLEVERLATVVEAQERRLAALEKFSPVQ
jgi:hypothetical protein